MLRYLKVNERPCLWIGGLIAVIVYVLTLLLQLNLFETLAGWLAVAEMIELDELVIVLFIMLCSIAADAYHQAKRIRSQEQAEALMVYNQMNTEIIDEISGHLTQLLAFRTSLLMDPLPAASIKKQLDQIILSSFNHYERAQRRSDIDSSLMPLVLPESKRDFSKYQ